MQNSRSACARSGQQHQAACETLQTVNELAAFLQAHFVEVDASLASLWAAVKEKYDHNLKVLQQDCAMHMAEACWLMNAESSGAEWLEFKADAARSWLGCTGCDKLYTTCAEMKTLLKSHRDVYEIFDQ